MKMKKTAVILGSMCMLAGAQMTQAATYDVTGVFTEPMAAYDTTFVGTFDWDGTNLSGLQGVMNASMYSDVPSYTLTNQFDFSYDRDTGDVVVSVFKENSTDVFFEGGYTAGDIYKLGAFGELDGFIPNENVYFTLAFNAFTMAGNVNQMVYGDCSATGLMGPMMTGDTCMTGHSVELVGYAGTMGAIPVSLDISAVPVPAAVWLFGSGLLGLVGVARRKLA